MDVWPALAAPVPALPLDVLRVLVGLLTFAYFARTWREAPLFGGPDGLVDHAQQRRLLPFTRLSLFPERISLRWLRLAYLAGCGAAILLTVGIVPHAAALVLYLLAVSAYRWNLLLMYVDDAVQHLVLLWMVLLPIGETLTLPSLVADPTTAWSTWLGAEVPGFVVRCFLVNLVLIYLVAGLWKWTSPMWRAGSALQAILRMAVAYTPDRWGFAYPMPLRIATWFGLVIEPLLAVLVLLPPYSPLKWPLLVGAVAFHVGIIATMKFPYANLAMLGALVVVFGPELMAALGAPPPLAGAAPAPAPGPADLLALTTITCLGLLFLLNARWFDSGHPPSIWRALTGRWSRVNPLYAPLWLLGLAQSYRLFDWIDDRNYHVRYEVCETPRDGPPRLIDERGLFPRSMRHILLQSYLYGNLWVKLDPDALPELRTTTLTRYAGWYCRTHPAMGSVDVQAIVQRITSDNLDLHRGIRMPLLRFTNRGGTAQVTEMCLVPPVIA